jgi:glycosyltransferase involved in cell wall biosynthesis
MYHKKTITALVPCYNEATRITHVLRPLIASKFIDEIIVIDDGSTDGSAAVVRKFDPKIKLIRNPSNIGKSGTISKGLIASASGTVFLIDADISGLKTYHLDKSIEIFFQKKLDMLFLPVKSEYFNAYTQAIGWNVLATGERIIRKNLLTPYLKQFSKGYALEMFINQLGKKNNWKMDVIIWKKPEKAPISPSKIKKMGLIKGIRGDFKMMSEIFKQTNVLEYLINLNSFVIRKAAHSQ